MVCGTGPNAFPHFLYILSHKKEKKSNKNKKPNDFNYLEIWPFWDFVTVKAKPNDFKYLAKIAPKLLKLLTKKLKIKNLMISTTYGKCL